MTFFDKSALSLTSLLFFILFSGHSAAKVFVCKAKDCDDDKWAPITPAQLNATSHSFPSVTVQKALSQSDASIITDSLGDKSPTDLYLKYDLWHMGGIAPVGTRTNEHITVYVYNSADPSKYITSCHIYPYLNSQGYITTCL